MQYLLITMKIFRTVIPSGSNCQTYTFIFQLCFLTADVADNHRCVGNCRESRQEMQEIPENCAWHVQDIGSKMRPLYLPAELSVLIWWDIYFLMHIWELGRKLSEDEMLQQFLVGWMERHQSCLQFEEQPRKRQPCTEVPLCLNTGDPQINPAASRAVLS